MEERSGGVYSPSPGVIYPTLQALEDQDYIKSSDVDGKKVYAITDAGLAYLQQNIDQTRARSEAEGDWTGDEARGEKCHHHRHFQRRTTRPLRTALGPRRPRRPGRTSRRSVGTRRRGRMGRLVRLEWRPGDDARDALDVPRLRRSDPADPRRQGEDEEIREVLREAKTKIDEIVMK